MMDGLILDIIKSIINEKRKNNQEPLLADTNEVHREVQSICKESLERIKTQGDIEMGKMLNFEWIKLK